jgi:hypothetical protein
MTVRPWAVRARGVPVGDAWRFTDPDRPEEGETRWGVLWNRRNGEISAWILAGDGDGDRGDASVLLLGTVNSDRGRAEMIGWLERSRATHEAEPDGLVELANAVADFVAADDRRERTGLTELTTLEFQCLELAAKDRQVTVVELLSDFQTRKISVTAGIREHSDDQLAAHNPEYARWLADRRRQQRARDRRRRIAAAVWAAPTRYHDLVVAAARRVRRRAPHA